MAQSSIQKVLTANDVVNDLTIGYTVNSTYSSLGTIKTNKSAIVIKRIFVINIIFNTSSSFTPGERLLFTANKNPSMLINGIITRIDNTNIVGGFNQLENGQLYAYTNVEIPSGVSLAFHGVGLCNY